MSALATAQRTCSYAYWVPEADALDPRRWLTKYQAAVAAYGFVEVESPYLVEAVGGGFVAVGVVGTTPPG